MVDALSPGSQPRDALRVYTRSWSAPVWRGSFGEIVAAIRAVQMEIDQIQSVGENGYQSLIVGFADNSRQSFASVDEMETAIEGVSPIEVSEFDVFLQGSGDTSVLISGGRFAQEGVQVSASGSLGFASGAVATVESRLSGGVKAGEQAARVSMGSTSWIFSCSALLLALAIAGLWVKGIIQVPEAALCSMLVGVGAIGVYALVVRKRRRRREPLPFELVEEGKQFADERDRDGPVWKMKAWFEQHPALSSVITLLLGAALSRATDLI